MGFVQCGQSCARALEILLAIAHKLLCGKAIVQIPGWSMHIFFLCLVQFCVIVSIFLKFVITNTSTI